jgi:hypothetical protein
VTRAVSCVTVFQLFWVDDMLPSPIVNQHVHACSPHSFAAAPWPLRCMQDAPAASHKNALHQTLQIK